MKISNVHLFEDQIQTDYKGMFLGVAREARPLDETNDYWLASKLFPGGFATVLDGVLRLYAPPRTDLEERTGSGHGPLLKVYAPGAWHSVTPAQEPSVSASSEDEDAEEPDHEHRWVWSTKTEGVQYCNQEDCPAKIRVDSEGRPLEAQQ